MTALDLAVVARRVWSYEFVLDTQRDSSGFKQCGQVPPAVGETIGKLKTVVGLDALYADAPACIPFEQPFQEVGRGICTLLWVGSQEAKPRELVNGGVLKQAQFRVCNTPAGHYLHIYLDPLAGIGHLLVGFGLVCLFLLRRRKQAQLAHYAEQALRAAGIATFPQPVPQLHHAKVWVTAAHIPDELQFHLCVLVGMAVGPSGTAGQGLHRSIPAVFPEVDV